VVGVLHHRGRRSGRLYSTPLGMRPSAGGFVIPLTFSNNAAWYQNVLAGGSCTVTYKGADHTLGKPEVIDFTSAAPSFPRYERLQFQLIGINEFLRLTTVGEETNSKERFPMAIDTKTFRNTGVLAASPRRPLGLALAVIAMAQLMVVLDVAIVNVALPSIQHQLHFSAPDLEWVVNAYLIAFGGLLLLGGRTGDLFGRVRMFVIGLLLFTAGSLAGGLATTSTFLIVARAVQGIGGAIVAPTALSLLADTFSEGPQRNRALGVYSAVSASGGALGLLLGGVITNYFSWRWILFVNVPIGLFLVFAAPRVLASRKGQSGRLDLPGAVSVTAAATLFVYGLSRAAIHGWGDTVTEATIVLAGVMLAAFVVIEMFTRQPLMPLAIFRNRNRSGAYALSLANGATLSGTLFLLTLFLQNVLGFSPLQAGFAFLPTAAGVVVGAGATSRLIGRTGPRVPMLVGALMSAIGFFWLSAITPDAAYPTAVFGPLMVLALGLGQIFVSTSIVTISGVTPRESGLASALLNVGRQLGGSIGIAVMGTVATSVTAGQLTRPLTHAVLDHALTGGFSAGFQVAGLISLVGFAAAFVAVRGRRSAQPAEVLREAA